MKSILEGRTTLNPANFGTASMAASGFRSLLSVVRGEEQRPSDPASVINGSAGDVAPRVEVLDEDGQAQRIVVTCACCRRIELRCEY